METKQKPSIYAQRFIDLEQIINNDGFASELATIFFQHLYKNKRNNALSKNFTDYLEEKFDFYLPEIVTANHADDGTIKFLLKLKDGHTVETVLIPFHKRFTVCLSSQVGCAMKCSFCYTGTMGLKRHLRVEEIIGQYFVATKYLAEQIGQKPVSPNIVFMGQGEPLHNFDAVKLAVEIFMDQKTLFLGPRQMTLSTAGYLPGLKRLNDFPKINIALSLHSPFNDIRKELIPINQHYPIGDILNALDEVELMKRQFITYEYLLIDELNDREADALELKKLLGNKKALINIIPFNPFPGSQYKRPSTTKVESFKQMLVAQSLRTMVRTTKGSDILAACGQLKSK